MKIIYVIVGLLLTMFVTGCQDEECSKKSTSAVKVFASAPSTRVNYTEDGDKTLVTWNEGDKILLFTDEQWVYYTASVQKGGATDVEFLPSGDFLQNSEGKAVYAVYSSADEYSIEEKKVHFGWNQLVKEDRQKEPYLYAVDTIRNGKLNLHFQHVLSYLKLTITKDMLPVSVTNGKLHRVMILADGFNINPTQIEFDLDRREITDVTMGSFSIVRLLEEHDFTVSDFVCYMPIIPCSGEGSISVSLHEDDTSASYYTLEKKVPEGGFLAGHVYKLTLDELGDSGPGGIYTLKDLRDYYEARCARDYDKIAQWRDINGVINIYADIDATSISNWGMDDISSDVIDGNGHTILVDLKDSRACFFGTNNGTIRNLTIKGEIAFINSAMVSIDGGVFCDNNWGTIYNCHSDVTFLDVTGGPSISVGGICYRNTGTIEACTNKGAIFGTGQAGGIAISLEGEGSILNCHNYGEVKVLEDNNRVPSGGIVMSCNGGTIKGCSNQGVVTSSAGRGWLGGISALVSSGTLDNNVNKGAVGNGDVTGGIVGIGSSTVIISNNINEGPIDGKISGGVCGIVEGDVTFIGNTNKGMVNGVSSTVENPQDIGQDKRIQKGVK